jgi:hypothetical protein
VRTEDLDAGREDGSHVPSATDVALFSSLVFFVGIGLS